VLPTADVDGVGAVLVPPVAVNELYQYKEQLEELVADNCVDD
jgi:hypothetical protein